MKDEDDFLLATHAIIMDEKGTTASGIRKSSVSSFTSSPQHQDPRARGPGIDSELDLGEYHPGLLRGWKAGLYYSAFLMALVLVTNAGVRW